MKDIFELLAKNVDPKGGLYVHLIQAKFKIEEPGKVIEAGMSVIKPGKFTGSLKGRMKSYLDPRYLNSVDMCWEDVREVFINVGFEIVEEKAGVH